MDISERQLQQDGGDIFIGPRCYLKTFFLAFGSVETSGPAKLMTPKVCWSVFFPNSYRVLVLTQGWARNGCLSLTLVQDKVIILVL